MFALYGTICRKTDFAFSRHGFDVRYHECFYLNALSRCRPLDLGYNKQRNGVLELPVSNAQLTSHRKSPQKITHKSYLSPASSPYCKSDSPLYKSRQSQAYPTKPFEYSRHTPSKQSTLPNQFSPISYSSKASTPNYQIPSPFVSGTPPSLNGVFPTAIQNFDLNLDRFSSFDPNFYLRYPHPAQLGMTSILLYEVACSCGAVLLLGANF